MNTFYIARHGETEYNKAGRLQGWIDTPLTPAGLAATKQAIATLRQVPIDVIYASDLGRAFVTAYIISRALGYTGEINRSAGLREVNYGDAAGMFRTEAYERYPRIDRDTHFTPPNGESLADMQARVFKTLQELDKMHTNATILLVCHSGVMAAVRSSHLGVDFGAHNIGEAYPHDFIGKFTLADGEIGSFEKVE